MLLGMRCRSAAEIMCGVAILAGLNQLEGAHAQVFSITDGNAKVTIDPDSSAGLFDWTVDGVDQVGTDWYWFRTDQAGEASVDTIGVPVVETPFPGFARITYAGGGIDVRLSYEVLGGAPGSGESSLSQSLRIQNTSQASYTLNFFRLADYNVGGTPGGDSGQIQDGIRVLQSDGGSPFSVESLMGSQPQRFQFDVANVLLGELTDGNPTTLSNQAGPLAGDVAAGFQYTRTLAPGQVLAFSTDSRVTIPEPTTLCVLLVAAGSLALVRRRGTN